MSDSPIVRGVQSVMEAVSARLNRQDDEIRLLRDDVLTRASRDELSQMREEQRITPALATQPTIDTDALVVRVAALVPPPKDGANGTDGKDGRDGKDAPEPNVEEIVARVAELTVPRILALIPTAKDGEKGERGEDGLTSIEEVRQAVREEVLLNQRSFYKGVFVPGSEYRTADAVTWDGSLWFAQRDTSAKPGTDDDWKLGVKKGRDGKR